jgi:hypothetical protein
MKKNKGAIQNPFNLTYEKEVQIYNRPKLEPGVEVSIKGIKGRHRFMCRVTNSKGESWLNAYSETGGVRSFTEDRLTRVHTKPKLRNK